MLPTLLTKFSALTTTLKVALVASVVAVGAAAGGALPDAIQHQLVALTTAEDEPGSPEDLGGDDLGDADEHGDEEHDEGNGEESTDEGTDEPEEGTDGAEEGIGEPEETEAGTEDLEGDVASSDGPDEGPSFGNWVSSMARESESGVDGRVVANAASNGRSEQGRARAELARGGERGPGGTGNGNGNGNGNRDSQDGEDESSEE